MPSRPKIRRLNDGKPNRTHYERNRGSASERGYGWKNWTKPGAMRSQCLERDQNVCQMCLKVVNGVECYGDAFTAENLVADHIVPLYVIRKVCPELEFELDNLQCLCVAHNTEKGKQDIKKYGHELAEDWQLTTEQRRNRQLVVEKYGAAKR